VRIPNLKKSKFKPASRAVVQNESDMKTPVLCYLQNVDFLCLLRDKNDEPVVPHVIFENHIMLFLLDVTYTNALMQEIMGLFEQAGGWDGRGETNKYPIGDKFRNLDADFKCSPGHKYAEKMFHTFPDTLNGRFCFPFRRGERA
jgi:hypothetical protein